MKTLRIRFIKIFLTVALLAGFLAAYFMFNPIRVSAVVDTNAFEMLDRGSMRLEEDYSGIRFRAKIGTSLFAVVSGETGYGTSDGSTAYFGMIVVPENWITTKYAEVIESSGYDYIAAFNAAVGEGKYNNYERISPYKTDEDMNPVSGVASYYAINGVISNVLYGNLNRNFVGIAYYVIDGEYTYATFKSGEEIIDSFSVSSLSGATLDLYKNGECTLTESQVGVLYSHIFRLEYKSLGYSAGTAATFAEIRKNDLIEEGGIYVDDQNSLVPEYTDDNISALIALTGSASSVSAEDGKAIISVGNYDRQSVKFLRPKTVGENAYLIMKVKTSVAARLGIRNASDNVSYEVTAATASDWKYAFSTNEREIVVPLSSIGYSQGDTLKEILLFSPSGSAMDITVSDIRYTELYESAANINKSQAIISYYLGDGLSGHQVMNFDDAKYSLAVDKGTVSDGQFSYGTQFQWVKFTFVDQKVVTTESGKADYIAIRIKSNVRTRIQNYESSNAKDIIHTDSNEYSKEWIYQNSDEYQTAIIPVSALGYSAGDTVKGVQLALWATGTFYVDYIEYVTMAAGLTESQVNIPYYLGDGLSGHQVMNFNDAKYSLAVDKGTVSEGQFSYGTQFQWVKFTFVDQKVVTTESGKADYIAIRIKSNVRTRIRNYEGSNEKDIIHTGSNEYSKEWIYQNSDEYQTAIIPVSALGYSAGDTVKGVQLAVWVADTFYVDYIEYVTMAAGLTESQALVCYNNLAVRETLESGLSEYQIANFDSDGYSALVAVTAGTATIEDGSLKFVTTGYGGVKINFVTPEQVNIGEDYEDYIVIRMKDDMNGKLADENGSHSYWAFHISSLNSWCYVRTGNWQTLIIPVSQLGYTDGSAITGIYIYNNEAGTLYVDYIEYVSLATGLDYTTAPAAYAEHLANRGA